MTTSWSLRQSVQLVTAVVLAASFATTVGAQTPDPRWKSMLGCWSSPDPATITLTGKGDAGLLCVVPLTSGNGVAVATIIGGEVVSRDSIHASGNRVSATRDGCPGWESATWSRDGHRLLLRSEFVCAGGSTRKGSAVFGMSPDGEWIQVQGVGVAANTGVRARRFVASTDVTIAYDTSSKSVRELAAVGFSTQTARLGAAAPMFNDDVVELVKAVDGYVADAWLTELGQTFWLNAKELARLSDAGLPSRTMDLMIALSNPKVFAIAKSRPTDAANAYGVRPGYGPSPRGNGMSQYSCDADFDRMLGFGYYPMSFADPNCFRNGLFSRGSQYGYNAYGYNSFGYGYGNGYYWGQTPVIIVTRGSGNDGSYQPASPQGRAVNGQGYTRDRGASGAEASPSRGYSAPSSSGSSSGGSGGSSSGSSAPASTGTSSGGGSTSTGRTAIPRPPGD